MSANNTPGETDKDPLIGAKQVTAELIISELNFLFQMSFLYKGLQDSKEEPELKKLKKLSNTAQLEAKIKAFSEQTLPHLEVFYKNFPDVEKEFGIANLLKVIRRNMGLPGEYIEKGPVEIPKSYFENFILTDKNGKELSSSAGCAAIAKHINYSSTEYSLFNSEEFKKTFLDLAYEAAVVKTTVERLTDKNDIQFHGRPILDFLALPFQRVGKYPLLAKDVIKKLPTVEKKLQEKQQKKITDHGDFEGKTINEPENKAPDFLRFFEKNMTNMIGSYSDKIDNYLQIHSRLNNYLDTKFFDDLKKNNSKCNNPNVGTNIILPCLKEIENRKKSIPSEIKKDLSAYMKKNNLKANLDLRIALETNPVTKLTLKIKRFFTKPKAVSTEKTINPNSASLSISSAQEPKETISHAYNNITTKIESQEIASSEGIVNDLNFLKNKIIDLYNIGKDSGVSLIISFGPRKGQESSIVMKALQKIKEILESLETAIKTKEQITISDIIKNLKTADPGFESKAENFKELFTDLNHHSEYRLPVWLKSQVKGDDKKSSDSRDKLEAIINSSYVVSGKKNKFN